MGEGFFPFSFQKHKFTLRYNPDKFLSILKTGGMGLHGAVVGKPNIEVWIIQIQLV